MLTLLADALLIAMNPMHRPPVRRDPERNEFRDETHRARTKWDAPVSWFR